MKTWPECWSGPWTAIETTSVEILALARAYTVVVVRARQNQGANNCECAICGQPELRMSDGCADGEQGHADETRSDDPNAAMMTKPKTEGHGT